VLQRAVDGLPHDDQGPAKLSLHRAHGAPVTLPPTGRPTLRVRRKPLP
jgi:hypothetical protein